MSGSRHVVLCLFCLVLVFLSGCKLKDVQDELKEGGFDLWYPAEAGIEPGQIWHLSGNEKTEIREKPETLRIKDAQVKFATLEKKIDASASLKANIANGLLGKAGDLQAAFEAAHVKDVTLNFGNSRVQRIVVGDLEEHESTFSAGYRGALTKVKNREPGWVLLAATVTTDGMTYTVTVEDKAKFDAQVKGAIEGLLGAGLIVNWKSNTKAELVIPNGQRLAIGFAPLRPELFSSGFVGITEDMSDEEYIKAIARPLALK